MTISIRFFQGIDMDFDTLMAKVADIDKMLTDGLITKEKADDWKQRLIRTYEDSEIPERLLPNDIAHLPGRLIEGIVQTGKAFVRASGKTYQALEEQEQQNNTGRPKKNIVDLYNDLQ